MLSMAAKRAAGVTLGLLLAAANVQAQVVPSPTPLRLQQDVLDLQGRANVLQGSGARALGMGGAFLARADDATAASWNPAGLSYLRLPELSAVWADARYNTSEHFPDGSLSKADHQQGDTPDFFAATYPVRVRSMSGAVQLSFQRVISFQYSRTIEEFNPLVGQADGGFDVIALGAGLQATRWLRIGLTLNEWFNGYSQHYVRAINTPNQVGTRTFDNDFSLSAQNANLGAIFAPSEKLNLGVVVKTGFTGRVTLRREREDVVKADPVDRLTSNDHTRFDVRLDFPAAIGAGASLRPWSAVTASLDYTRSFWSKGQIHNFFTLPKQQLPEETVSPEGPDFFPDDPITGSGLPYPSLIDPKQEDTEQLRAGIEYVVIRGRLRVPLRVGYFNDRQFFRSISGRAPRFDALTAGAGIVVGRVLLDAAYVYEHGHYVDVDMNSVRVRSHRVFASLIYRHSGH
jgi:long-subunit fatty acid transport protein